MTARTAIDPQDADALAAPAGSAKPHRIEALDGVRGVAALIVVLHHALLAAVVSLAAVIAEQPRVDGTAARLLARTPLGVVWDGPAAVIVFFVLSGLVLALPHAAGRPPAWAGYYVSRSLRLYLPLWGALVVAIVCRWLVGWQAHGAGTWWLLAHGQALPVRGELNSATLVDPSYVLVGSIWSLRWEVAFSLLLPLYVASARSSVLRLPLLIGAFVTVGAAATEHQAAAAMPVFLVGVLMAYERKAIERAVARLAGPLAITTAAALLAVLLTAHWWAIALPWSLERALTLAGAAGVVALGIGHAGTQQLLTRPPLRWLGSRSFSLYLVHEPIVTSVGFLLGRPSPAALSVPLALAASLLGAEFFCRVVEQPAHRLARRAGREFAASARANQTRRRPARASGT